MPLTFEEFSKSLSKKITSIKNFSPFFAHVNKSPSMPKTHYNRIFIIDAMRGLVMILMTIDHLIHLSPFITLLSDPIDVQNASFTLFLLRWIGHLCAPTFILLCGMSVFAKQYLKNIQPKALSKQIFIRGIFLILLECTVITFGWTFTLSPFKLFLQVIFAIGSSLIFLSLLIRYLKPKQIFLLSLSIIIFDNVLDLIPISFSENSAFGYFWALLHKKITFWSDNQQFMARTTYPIFSWMGVIGIGYYLGQFYVKDDSNTIAKISGISCALLCLVPVLRYLNAYGDPNPYSSFDSSFDTFLSFINFTKYPPSLLFLMTFISLSLVIMNKMKSSQIGKNPLLIWLGSRAMGYYIIHIYVITLFYKAASLIIK